MVIDNAHTTVNIAASATAAFRESQAVDICINISIVQSTIIA